MGVQPGGGLVEHFERRADDDHDAVRFGMAAVAEEAVGASDERADAIHRALDDVGHGGVVGVGRLARLEEGVRVVGRAADHRPLGREGPGAVRAHQVVVDRRPDLLVGDQENLVLFVRRAEPVEEEHHRHASFERGHLRHQRQVVRLLHRCRGQHREADHACAHHVRVVAEDGQRLRGNRARRDVKDARRQLAGDLVHVRQHQQEALGRRERRRERAALQRAVDRPRRAALRLHLLDERHLAPDVLDALGRPRIGQLRHRRGRRDREDGAGVVDAIGDMGGGRVAVHDHRLHRHADSPLLTLARAQAPSSEFICERRSDPAPLGRATRGDRRRSQARASWRSRDTGTVRSRWRTRCRGRARRGRTGPSPA